MRRWICLLLTLLCVMSSVGCAGQSDTSDPAGDASSSDAPADGGPPTFAVAYSADDTLNPYTAATEVNVNLASLLYTGLFHLDGGFTPQKALAAETTVTDMTHIEVTLRRDAVFSDGSAVTVQDVLTSYHSARSSANYKVLLDNVTSATAKHGVLTFTLRSPDPNALACLTFPVYKAASATDAAGQAPIGAGPYMLTYEEDTASLTANPHAATPRYDTIGLRHLPNAEKMYYGLTSGNITYYYNDLNTGDIPRVTGASASVNMNALVFLGINHSREALSDATVRRALSTLVDRKTVAAATYAGWASAATTPFHPAWSAMADIVGVADTRDLAGAVGMLDSVGYGTAKDQKKLALELIYSNEGGFRSALAERLRSEFEGAGIQLTVTPLAYEEYQKRLAAGQYDLYIGEMRLAANMDLTPLFQYGADKSGEAFTAYTQYRAGEQTLAEFCNVFQTQMPYIPLCWRSGFAAYDRRLATVTPHGYDPYYGIENWQ